MNDKQAFRQYTKSAKAVDREVRDIRRKMQEPSKIELGLYLIEQRELGRSVQNILEGMGTNNRVLAYECMELAENYAPDLSDAGEPINLIDFITFEYDKPNELLTITPVRPIRPHEWPTEKARGLATIPWSNPIAVDMESGYPENLEDVNSPAHAEIMHGTLRHLLEK